jgi:hypothetical protein
VSVPFKKAADKSRTYPSPHSSTAPSPLMKYAISYLALTDEAGSWRTG